MFLAGALHGRKLRAMPPADMNELRRTHFPTSPAFMKHRCHCAYSVNFHRDSKKNPKQNKKRPAVCRLQRRANLSIKQVFCFHFQFSSSDMTLLLEMVPYPDVARQVSCHSCTFSVDRLTRSQSGSDMSVSKRDTRKKEAGRQSQSEVES